MSLKIAMAQLNFWVGDISGNVQRMIDAAHRARDDLQADLIVFPELCLIGYPPDDLLYRSGLPQVISTALERLKDEVSGIGLLFGYPEYAADGLYNAAMLLSDGEVIAEYRKQRRPNYGVFDEKRHFSRGRKPCVVNYKGLRLGLTICEDIWGEEPARLASEAGAQLLININASPFQWDKSEQRCEVLSQRAIENNLPIIYVNCVGGQDELVFDGRSMLCSASGEILYTAPDFHEGLFPVGVDDQGCLQSDLPDQPDRPTSALIYRALTQGIKDYVDHNGFPGVLIGLSGGIDSALTLALAVDALGAERVWAVTMPSRYTSDMSNDDAALQAQMLGVRFDCLPIESGFTALLDTLSPIFEDVPVDLTEENIQARIRGLLLMALSNKFGHIVLATGNKSEMAVGYATLYGDMCGGFAPLKDLYKTRVYELARWRNEQAATIPERVIERPPSAELRPDQTDQDSLPDYDVLDEIVRAYVEQQQSIVEIVAQGYAEADVRQVVSLIRRNEYKRRQAPPGPKITEKAFGRDRRYPITAQYGDF